MQTALRPLGMLVSSCCALALLHPLPLQQVRFSAPVWRSISQEAKDCLRAMLQPDPQQRPTALQVGPPFPHFLSILGTHDCRQISNQQTTDAM